MYYFMRDTPSAYRDGWHLGLSMSSKQEKLIQDTVNCGHGNFLSPSLLKWLADDNDFSGTICCLCVRHWRSTSNVLHSDLSWYSILYVCVVYVFLNKRKTARKINCHARMWQEEGLSSSFFGRFLKSVHRLFCQGGHLCSSIITSYSDTVDFFFSLSICSALRLDSIHSDVRMKEAVCGKKRPIKTEDVWKTLRKMKQKAALLFGILGDIPWEYKLCPLFKPKRSEGTAGIQMRLRDKSEWLAWDGSFL